MPRVIAIVEWPRRSWTTRGCTPLSILVVSSVPMLSNNPWMSVPSGYSATFVVAARASEAASRDDPRLASQVQRVAVPWRRCRRSARIAPRTSAVSRSPGDSPDQMPHCAVEGNEAGCRTLALDATVMRCRRSDGASKAPTSSSFAFPEAQVQQPQWLCNPSNASPCCI